MIFYEEVAADLAPYMSSLYCICYLLSNRLPVSQKWCSPYIGVGVDNKLSLMYKITHNLIAIPISDFLIPLVRPSQHYHPLSYRLITATTDYYNFSFFPRAVFHWNNLPLETVACSTSCSLQDWPRLTIENHQTSTFNPNLYPHLFYF